MPNGFHFIGEYELKQNDIDFESAREILTKEDDKVVVRRRFGRLYNMMEVNFYTKCEEIPENKEIFVYGFKHFRRDEIDNYTLIGRNSDVIYENDNLFNCWSNSFINEEMEKRNFKIREWSFMTLVKNNIFLKIYSLYL